jgi:putrescine transport system permease protein
MPNAPSNYSTALAGSGRFGLIWSLLRRFGPPRWSEYVLKYWSGQRAVIAVPYLWLLLFFLVPFVIVFKISFSEIATAQPPYEPLIQRLEDLTYAIKINLNNYAFLFTDDLYYTAYLYSLKVAAVSTFWCLLLGYPMAYAISRSTPAQRNLYLMLIILPFWTSFLLRVYAWIGLLKTDGVINSFAGLLGLGPYSMMYTNFAVYIGIVYSYLPFMILPLYSNLEKHDFALIEAAQDLGASPAKAFFRITLPLSLPGILAGCLLVFIPAVGEYVIPSLLGSSDQLMIGRVLTDEFFSNRDWPVASAVAIVMLVLLLLPIIWFQRFQNRELEAKK